MATRKCGECGKENQAHYRFCLGCGHDLGAGGPSIPTPVPEPDRQTRCKYCGGVVPARRVKCLLCGAPQ